MSRIVRRKKLYVFWAVFSVLTLAVIIFAVTRTINKGLDIGISYNRGRMSPVVIAVKSDKREFDIDDVTLNFYYGHRNVTSHELSDQNYVFETFALYFLDGTHESEIEYITKPHKDYKNIKGHHFIKEISDDEFETDKYKVTPKGVLGTKFAFRESLTVPKEVFEREKGTFGIRIVAIYYSEKDEGYCTIDQAALYMKYEYKGEDDVLISELSGKIPY